jgi:hypothetical protein
MDQAERIEDLIKRIQQRAIDGGTQVRCPICNAGVGKFCRLPDGTAITHPIRIELQRNMALKQPVKGQAKVGDVVTYEDMANPPRTYRVELLPIPGRRSDYVLADIQTGDLDYSDLRQIGWTR